ncbi:hypothetical protein SCD_n01724 [Sulfuricella denitrificans skB26]|uniref:Uncharacterized protein n=1 Tax=Sulfuricella denitrificans (strain DSM 22764 / NBRC 105220 / skB26) TaxID=1163617 RepID=S6ALG9_SULDS|nr:hypothetical protein SCD_n01724 [Sulfuricella denitrificans skB26]
MTVHIVHIYSLNTSTGALNQAPNYKISEIRPKRGTTNVGNEIKQKLTGQNYRNFLYNNKKNG